MPDSYLSADAIWTCLQCGHAQPCGCHAKKNQVHVYKFSRENTARTQAIVDDLHRIREVLLEHYSYVSDSPMVQGLTAAIQRFAAIDGQIVLPDREDEK